MSAKKSGPVGVFDSGMGGVSVLYQIHKMMPNEDLIFIGDSKNNPYGTKTRDEIKERCFAICDDLVNRGCKAIVVACNTATSACIQDLRDRYDIDIIGMEPALKPACERGEHQKIAVWATDFTLKEKKFADLMERFAADHEITKVPCPKLVRLVEEDALGDEMKTSNILNGYIELSGKYPDSIVLGCTHFIFFKKLLRDMLPETVELIDGNFGTAHHLQDLLKEKDLLNEYGGQIEFLNTLESKVNLSKQLFKELEEIK